METKNSLPVTVTVVKEKPMPVVPVKTVEQELAQAQNLMMGMANDCLRVLMDGDLRRLHLVGKKAEAANRAMNMVRSHLIAERLRADMEEIACETSWVARARRWLGRTI